jgi:hypothetical protein
MKSVKVGTAKLLDILKSNREMHIAEFESAMIEFRKDAITEMKKNLSIAEAGGEVQLYVTLTQPTSYETSYNTVIKMLELSEETTVELSTQEFQQYVEDNWAWKVGFLASTSMYNNSKA